jgi:uncharacterized protein (TIGR02646 family)
MRPVNKGNCPQHSDGKDIVFSFHQDARGMLIERLGQYCSYCEMKLDSALAVEHVQPKQPEGSSTVIKEREVSWDNFLLACPNCNSTKGRLDVVLDDYLWPHKDNTFFALRYSEGGMVSVSDQLSCEMKKKADNTIRLTGLHKNPFNDQQKSDRRSENRRKVWDIACEAKSDLAVNQTVQMRRSIVNVATGHAYWSVWMTVFKDDPDMCKRLINAFPGTCSDCFDEQNAYSPIQRSSGQI